MQNPFEILESKLSNIENLLLQLREKPIEAENKLLSVKEIAKLSGVSELTVRNWISDGKVKAKRIGRRMFIEQSQFISGLEEVKSLKYKR
ncbi:helix-turn-helix domain-containing protein [Flavobacterium aquatile]|uniref:Helix-turn-helix domain-containing protein n=1 Tax=Flavobacterium aquatile LMG 4008 = ATCC 11947 TaxID=1453498 RepID=A0A095STF3_9FLAO|nr:helix-turn-helix domain-containing protein [Flavobacterium aquatile]KGD67589.1 hypothetical protein LG45_10655 [Flavobacterium aquatile LMG 4008 = ATCC 11947]OXA65479.1 DNA-binding protein [Flavobacterium aquatile] [Flavobacterium aquatile LMG 4008 = ATCC 11947]GEC80202.1 DNA-binding protein [Flavobacterium aquatile]